jgi:hypothetical protein
VQHHPYDTATYQANVADLASILSYGQPQAVEPDSAQ